MGEDRLLNASILLKHMPSNTCECREDTVTLREQEKKHS